MQVTVEADPQHVINKIHPEVRRQEVNLWPIREYSGVCFFVSFWQKILVVENNIEQRTVNLQCAVRTAGVINEAQFPESIHEEADS